ncbi:hypothetical protein [Sulfitobacter sp.]|uniref:hypothetical protein n=1 Tax=Sulfitobacter sp. TaxID=1903071 RepID=UPI003003622F
MKTIERIAYMFKAKTPFANIRFARRQAELDAGLRQEEQVLPWTSILPSKDKTRMANCAISYVDHIQAKTGKEHLDRTQKALIRPLMTGVTISRLLTEHDADVLAATLHDEMPWLTPAMEQVWNSLRQFARDGLPGYHRF